MQTGIFGVSPRAESVAAHRAQDEERLRKSIGERFKQARDLNGLQQGQAGTMMGLSGGTMLSLVEGGKRMVSVEMLIQASRVYMVSADYLLGVSDDPERDRRSIERTAAIRHYDDLIKGALQSVTELLMRELGDFAPMSELWLRISAAMADVLSAFDAYRTANEEAFETSRGSARLDAAMSRMSKVLADGVEVMQGKEGKYTNISDLLRHQPKG